MTEDNTDYEPASEVHDDTFPVQPSGHKVSVTYERKVGTDNYGSRSARAWVEGEVPVDADQTAVAQALIGLFGSAVAAVAEQLDIEVEFNQETGVLREKAAPVVVVTENNSQSASKQVREQIPGSSELRIMNPADSEKNGPLPEWLFDKAAAAGVTAVWDNRHSIQGTRKPHFVEAIPKGGVGKGREGSALGFWP